MYRNIFSKPSEKGQALIIVALAMVVLLGFTALAVDGGMIYTDRRGAQTASDAGALAGGWKIAESMDSASPRVTYGNWSCNLSQLDTARSEGVDNAILQTGNNNYTIDDDISDNNGVGTECYEIDLGTYIDKYIDISDMVTSEVQTAFAHFVFGGEVANTVTAVVRVRPQTPLAFGHAVVALNESGCQGNQNGVVFGGSSNIDINGGGVYSAGCMRGNGSNFTVDVVNGNVTYIGAFSGEDGNISPSPEQQSQTLPPSSIAVPTPDCSGLTNRGDYNNGSGTLQPGIYSRIRVTNGEHTMQPGLYCITGSQGMTINGGEFIGENVTIYVEQGGITINGNVDPLQLSAPQDSNYTPAIQGVLIYLAEGNTSDINLQGNSNSSFLGLIYAPDGDVDISGTNGTTPTFNTQIIANNVFISGNADLDINFDGPQNYQRPASLNLQE